MIWGGQDQQKSFQELLPSKMRAVAKNSHCTYPHHLNMLPTFLKHVHKRLVSFTSWHQLFLFLQGSKMKILIFSILALAQICSCRKTSQIQAVRNAVLQGYEKDAKPDGKVDVKTGMKVTKFSLCAHKQVQSQTSKYSPPPWTTWKGFLISYNTF